MRDKLAGVTSTMTDVQCTAAFKDIARDLVENYAIQRAGKTYRLLEIEFYFYNSLIDDYRDESRRKHLTYERTTPAGHWFFHASGVDLTFASDQDKGYGGGILIRGIIDERGHITRGPLNCRAEMFPSSTDAFVPTAESPHLVAADPIDRHLEWTARRNLPDKQGRPWRCNVLLRTHRVVLSTDEPAAAGRL